MSALAILRRKYPTLPRAYFDLLAQLDGWEGWVNDGYTVFFDSATALTATDEYELPTYRSGYFALGTDGGGEVIVCALDGPEDRPVFHLAAIGMSDAALLPIAPTTTEFARALLASARGSNAQ